MIKTKMSQFRQRHICFDKTNYSFFYSFKRIYQVTSSKMMLCNWKEQYGNLSINMLRIIIKVCKFLLDLDYEFVYLLQKMRGHDCFYVAYIFTSFQQCVILTCIYRRLFFIIFFNKDDDRNVQEDGEIQGFYQELTAPRASRAMIGSGGCGMNV